MKECPRHTVSKKKAMAALELMPGQILASRTAVRNRCIAMDAQQPGSLGRDLLAAGQIIVQRGAVRLTPGKLGGVGCPCTRSVTIRK